MVMGAEKNFWIESRINVKAENLKEINEAY